MKRIKLISFFLMFTVFFQGLAFAQTQAPTTTPKEEGVTLAAQKVDPAQIAKEEAEAAKVAAPPVKKEKKPLPIFLQPIEFVITSIVNALFFWKKGDELNR